MPTATPKIGPAQLAPRKPAARRRSPSKKRAGAAKKKSGAAQSPPPAKKRGVRAAAQKSDSQATQRGAASPPAAGSRRTRSSAKAASTDSPEAGASTPKKSASTQKKGASKKNPEAITPTKTKGASKKKASEPPDEEPEAKKKKGRNALDWKNAAGIEYFDGLTASRTEPGTQREGSMTRFFPDPVEVILFSKDRSERAHTIYVEWTQMFCCLECFKVIGARTFGVHVCDVTHKPSTMLERMVAQAQIRDQIQDFNRPHLYIVENENTEEEHKIVFLPPVKDKDFASYPYHLGCLHCSHVLMISTLNRHEKTCTWAKSCTYALKRRQSMHEKRTPSLMNSGGIKNKSFATLESRDKTVKEFESSHRSNA